MLCAELNKLPILYGTMYNYGVLNPTNRALESWGFLNCPIWS